MFNRQLETFIKTADSGSFLKVSEELYLSPTAVAKQINTLEHNLGFVLFERTHNGLKLTPQGVSFYHDAEYILKYFRESVDRARNAGQGSGNLIRIGMSPMSPGNVLLEIWSRIREYCPGLKFQLVSFENTFANAKEILANVGKKIDVVMGIFDDLLLESGKCHGLKLFEEKLCCGISVQHPLAEKESLTVQDLCGEHLMLLERGVNGRMDAVRNELKEKYPEVWIEDIPFYGMDTFNRCVTTDHLLIVAENWENVHPLIKTVPMEWEYTTPFGLLYSSKPSSQVWAFICAVAQVYGVDM